MLDLGLQYRRPVTWNGPETCTVCGIERRSVISRVKDLLSQGRDTAGRQSLADGRLLSRIRRIANRASHTAVNVIGSSSINGVLETAKALLVFFYLSNQKTILV